MKTETIESPIFAAELKSLLGITHTDTLRVKIKEGKVPPPDVKLTNKTRYRWRSTLVKAGLLPGDKVGQA